jgi:hypothetical protein
MTFSALARSFDVGFVKRRGVGDAIGLGFRRKLLDDGHALEIDDADLVLAQFAV